jgi:hypothetical protein
MTPTSPSIAAGSDALRSWLRRVRGCPAAAAVILRGSLLLEALCEKARTPVDVDHLVPGRFDAAACEALARAVCAVPDVLGPMEVADTLVLYPEGAFPGMRVFARVDGSDFQIDFGFGDPLPEPPREIEIAGVGPVLACTAETLFGWKLHGLVEHGRGHWRAKDLYDLWLLWTAVPLDRSRLRPAIELAFASRATPLAMLDDFRTRAAWGESRGGQRKWRTLSAKLPETIAFTIARATVREAIAQIL